MNLKNFGKLNDVRCDNDLSLKISEFSQAIEKYNQNRIYSRIEFMTSILIISLQVLTLIYLVVSYDGSAVIELLIAFVAAYFLTDFINGFAHMYMDNNTSYNSIAGPFISSFHLHHSKLIYKIRPSLSVYFHESGTKFWLLGYLVLLAVIQQCLSIPYGLNLCLVSIGILSSIAELSHYWCHHESEANKFIRGLQKYGLLLSKQHHMQHHKYDNTHYAFLNGISDPLLNMISKHLYRGYKQGADKHTAAYTQSNLD